MNEDKKFCGSCIWHIHCDGEWVCSNEDTEEYGLETEYSYVCDDYYSK